MTRSGVGRCAAVPRKGQPPYSAQAWSRLAPKRPLSAYGADKLGCDPFEKKLERMESRDRLLRSLGVG